MPIPNMQQGKMKTGLMDVVSKMGPEGETAKPPGLDLLKIKFDVPDDRRPYLLDWSRSNLENSFRLGYEAGQRFVYLHPEVL
jgi:hypothetical protein